MLGLRTESGVPNYKLWWCWNFLPGITCQLGAVRLIRCCTFWPTFKSFAQAWSGVETSTMYVQCVQGIQPLMRHSLLHVQKLLNILSSIGKFCAPLLGSSDLLCTSCVYNDTVSTSMGIKFIMFPLSPNVS